MPELPEVETIVRGLDVTMPGARVTGALIGLPKIVKVPPVKFKLAITGAVVERVWRRAKLIIIELRNNWSVVIHLKMSGQLVWKPRTGRMKIGGHPIPHGLENLPNKYSHVIFNTSRGTLFFNDQRQFGYVRLVKTRELPVWLADQGYGPEPLDADFHFDDFRRIMKTHRVKRIKPTLMDQTVLAGVGNIYADEACFYAAVRPARRIKTLTLNEQRRLYQGLRHIMNLAIRQQGTTAADYRTAAGQPGRMSRYLRVYGRDGQPCRRCRKTLTKTVLAGRGTHYCSACQK